MPEDVLQVQWCTQDKLLYWYCNLKVPGTWYSLFIYSFISILKFRTILLYYILETIFYFEVFQRKCINYLILIMPPSTIYCFLYNCLVIFVCIHWVSNLIFSSLRFSFISSKTWLVCLSICLPSRNHLLKIHFLSYFIDLIFDFTIMRRNLSNMLL